MSQAGLMDVPAAAAYLNVSEDTIYRMVSRQQLPCVRFGRAIRFSQPHLDMWIEQRMTAERPDDTPEPAIVTTSRQRAASTRRRAGSVPPPERPGYTPIRPVPRNL